MQGLPHNALLYPKSALHFVREDFLHSPDQFVHFLHGIDGLAEMSGMGHSHRIPGQVLAHLPDTDPDQR